MIHEDWYQEVIESQTRSPQTDKEQKDNGSQEMVTRTPACRHYRILWDFPVVIDGILWKKFLRHDGSDEYLQFLVPFSMKKKVLYQMHDSLVSGHLGCKKTKAKVLQRFYWYALMEDISLYIQRCDTGPA